MKKLVTILLLLFAGASYAQKTTLALNLTKGNTYYMVSNANSVVSQTINNQLQNINSNITAKMAFTVIDLLDSAYVMHVQYDRIGIQMTMPNGTLLNFESDNTDKSNTFSVIMANMTHKPFSIVMSKTGKLLSISNTDALAQGLFEGVTGLTEDQQKQFREQLMKSFGPVAFKGNLEMGTAVFPSVKVAINDKWHINVKTQASMQTKVSTTFTLNEVTASAFMVHGESVISPDNNNKFIVNNGMPMKYNVNGISEYDVKIDRVSGWISEARINQVIKGNVEIEDNPRLPGGMIIPMTVTDDQTISDN